MLNKLFFILPFFLPTYLVKFNLPPGGSINLLDIIILIYILICIFDIHTKQKEVFAKFISKNKTSLTLIALFIFGLILSFIMNANETNLTDSLGTTKSFYILPIIFSVLASFYALQNKALLKNFFVGYLLYSSLLAIIGTFYLINHNLTYDNRLAIFFESPNQLAMALTPGVLIGISYLLSRKSLFFLNINLSYGIILLTILQLFILLRTGSLGALIGLAFAGFFLIFKNLRSQTFLLATALSFVSLFLIFNASFFLKLATYTPNIPANAFDSRLAIYQADEKILKNNFLFGVGPGNFQQTYLGYQRYFPPYPQWAVPHAHNLFTNIWLETGIIGLLSFLAVIYLVYKKIPFRENDVRIYVMTCVSILIYFLIHGLFDTTYWKNDLAVLFWLTTVISLEN